MHKWLSLAVAPRSAIQIVTVSSLRDLEKNWKTGRPKADSVGGSFDSWTTYEMIHD